VPWALADAGVQVKDPEQHTEHVRRALGNAIAHLYMDEEGTMRAITLGSRLEASLMSLFAPRAAPSGSQLLTPETLASLLRELQGMTSPAADARPTPLIVPPGIRLGIRRLVEPVMPALPVISLAELPPFVNLNTVATWELKHAS